VTGIVVIDHILKALDMIKTLENNSTSLQQGAKSEYNILFSRTTN